MEAFRNIILIITGFSTIVGFCIKWTNNLIIELIKAKFRIVPCKNNLFETTIRLLIIIVVMITLSFLFMEPTPHNVDNLDSESSLFATIVTWIIGIVYLVSLGIAEFKLIDIKDIYLKKFIDNKMRLRDREIILIRIGRFSSLCVGCYTSILAVYSISVYLNNPKDLDYNYIGVVVTTVIAITSILLYFIYDSAYAILEDLRKDIIYIIKMKSDSDSMICSLFLDVDGYYVCSNKNGEIRYISQSNVSEIIIHKNS